MGRPVAPTGRGPLFARPFDTQKRRVQYICRGFQGQPGQQGRGAGRNHPIGEQFGAMIKSGDQIAIGQPEVHLIRPETGFGVIPDQPHRGGGMRGLPIEKLRPDPF